MMSQEIQEMLEGLLNDEQTAEVLHRLSVSPEKLTAFRQHMALQGAFDRDGRASEMSEDEDKAVWAAVLGATGGVVTGGAATGAGSWLARAAAFVATGIAGFFIGTAADVDLSPDNATTDNAQNRTAQVQTSPAKEQITANSKTAPAIARVDTVVKTVIKPEIVYRDRIVYRDADPANSLAAVDKTAEPKAIDNNVATISAPNSIAAQTASTSSPSGISAEAQKSLTALSSRNNSVNVADDSKQDATTDPIFAAADNDAQVKDPNAALKSSSPTTDEEPAAKSPNGGSPEDRNNPSTLVSLVRAGWEIAYNERIGRVTPPPTGLESVEPNFGGRALDLSYRMMEGRFGVGLRLMYGSFSRVTLEEEEWTELGETIFRPALGTEEGFGTELFLNYRFPLFSDRLALGAELMGGALVTQSKIGADVSLLYLITNRIGAQAGIGYSHYWYNTRAIRQEALQRFDNTGTTSELNDIYRGTMLEGRYGLFYRF